MNVGQLVCIQEAQADKPCSSNLQIFGDPLPELSNIPTTCCGMSYTAGGRAACLSICRVALLLVIFETLLLVVPGPID